MLESNPPRLLSSQIILVTCTGAQGARQAELGHVLPVEACDILVVGLGDGLLRLADAEVALRGREPAEAVFRDAAEILVKNAKPHRYNGFKVELARRATVRALLAAGERG